MPLEYATIRDLASGSDPLGVLSIYATLDPSAEAAEPPPWRIRVRNRLTELRDTAPDSGDVAQALRRVTDDLLPRLDRELSGETSGRGRALFAMLSTGETRRVDVPTEVGDAVACDRIAHVRPLLEAWACGSPAGIVVTSGDGLRIYDHRFGRTEQLESEDFTEPTDDWREMKGPPDSNPAHPRQPGAQRDLFDARLLEHQRKFLSARRRTVERHARDHGWRFLVVTGEPQLRDALFDNLAELPGCWRLRSDQTVPAASPSRVAELVAGDLAAARRRRDDALMQRVREHKNVAWGPIETRQAVLDGQADILLLRRGSPPHGESDTAEELIAAAFDKGTTVELLHPDATEPLAEADGVAALLRW